MNGDIGIGRLIDQERGRDAIHMAVAPVEAGEKLVPGARVGLVDGKAMEVDEAIGIVDPFLTKAVRPGQRFYLFLFPGTITSLRHEWVHPAFEGTGEPKPAPLPQAKSEKAVSEAWLREYAKKVNPHYAEGGYYYEKGNGLDTSYEVLMADLAGNTLTYNGIDMHGRGDLIDAEELRRHASVVLGRPINFDTFEYFSCTC
jgi:hypothetical protein